MEVALNPNPDRLINSTEAAEMLGIRPQTLVTWRSTGKSPLRAIRVGSRAIRYRYGDIIEFIESQRETTGDAA